MFDTPPRRPARRARRALSRGQVHLNPAFALWFVPLNVHLPPFDDVRVRQRLQPGGRPRRGGEAVRRPAAGRRRHARCCRRACRATRAYCPYPHDPAAARRLVRPAARPGRAVTLVTDDSPVSRAIGTYLRRRARPISAIAPGCGRCRPTSSSPTSRTRANRVQASLTNWYADYPSAANFLAGDFGCAAFRPGSDSLAEHLRLLRPGAGRAGCGAAAGDPPASPRWTGRSPTGAGRGAVQPALHRRRSPRGSAATPTTRRSAG